MKALRNIALISVLHFVVSFAAFWHSLGSIVNFDSGEMPSTFDRVCGGAVNVLWFPFTQVAEFTHVRGGSLAEWLLLFMNSLLWGVILFGISRLCRQLLQPRVLSHETVV